MYFLCLQLGLKHRNSALSFFWLASVMSIRGHPGSTQCEQTISNLFMELMSGFLLFIGISSMGSGGYKAASMKDEDFYPRQVE